MNQEVYLLDGKVNVTLKGEFFLDQSTWIRDELFPYVEKGFSQFIFDFTDVEAIDSSGIGVLIAIQKKAKGIGGGVVINGMHGNVRKTFELAELNKVFIIHF